MLFFQGPLEKQMVSLLKAYGSGAMHGGNKEMSI